MQTFQTFFNNALSSAQNPSSLIRPLNPATYLRNLDQKSLAGAGVVLAEVIGFFTIGEMIGRFKVVGYRGGNHHEEH
jgi:F-type H+-transporting ATPase subunit g